jgi:hypothetical protein
MREDLVTEPYTTHQNQALCRSRGEVTGSDMERSVASTAAPAHTSNQVHMAIQNFKAKHNVQHKTIHLQEAASNIFPI